MLFLGYFPLFSQANSPVRLSETYELANIILALTDYGKTDPWEVSQSSVYYREVRQYTDFITLPDFILSGKTVQAASEEEIAAGTHMLFTELDHAFVNPLSAKYQNLIKANFSNQVWDKGSGYETDSLATFNEYMTWGIYDLYVQRFFPTVANKVSLAWAKQNATRGFHASVLFNEELSKMYRRRKRGQTIADLYPAFIKQLGQLQSTLAQPPKK